jgi:hypothetical protein
MNTTIQQTETSREYRWASVAVTEAQRETPSIKTKLEALVIASDADEKICIETGVIIARIEKDLENSRKKIVDPLNKQVKEINSFFKPFTDNLAALKETARQKIGDYRAEKERKRLEEQRRLDAILAKQREDELKKAAETGTAAPAIGLTIPVAPVANTVHSDTGAATGRTVWKWSVEDLSKVPDEYFILDEKKINGLVRGGVREIAGLKIYEDKEVSFRT